MDGASAASGRDYLVDLTSSPYRFVQETVSGNVESPSGSSPQAPKPRLCFARSKLIHEDTPSLRFLVEGYAIRASAQIASLEEPSAPPTITHGSRFAESFPIESSIATTRGKFSYRSDVQSGV
jgi:hypothetical protein